jgi:pimeloyl-ACP methyl ester carboxylesterase
MPLSIRHHDVVVDGVRLHVAEAGQGPALVLVPGQSLAWDSYQRVLPALASRYRVLCVDVRGHGRSEHTPGRYTFSRCADDLVGILRDLVGEPALCAGNSSGGVIAMLAAARAPQWVRGVLAEDPPLFSTDWPRLRDDTWVHDFFVHVVATLPDLAGFFSTLRVPVQGNKKLMSFPRPLSWVLGGAIRRRQRRAPGAPVDIAWLPLQVRLFVRGLSEYDVDFTRACVDGRLCDVDQAHELARVSCPMTLVQAASFRRADGKLVGAMDDDDVDRAARIKPDLVVHRVNKPHVVHIADPRSYVRWVDELAARCGPRPG